MRLSSAAAGACSLALAAALTVAPATAGVPHHHHPRGPDVVADGFLGPLSLAVGHSGTITVTQAFAGAVTQIDRRGEQTLRHEILDPEDGGIAGAAEGRRGAT